MILIKNERDGIGIGVSHFPYRKKPCLYVQIGNCATKVASFNSEHSAEWFLEQVKKFFGESVDWQEGDADGDREGDHGA